MPAENIAPPRHRPDDACFQPERSAGDRWIALLLFVAAGLYLYLFFDYTVLNADEGIVLQGAQRILEGQVLYRDFFSFYTPGSYYWMALLFKIFGSSILVGRGVLIVYGGLFAVLTYLLARRVCSRSSALLACYVVTLTCLPFRFLVLHNWDSTLLACLALYCAVLLLEREHWVWAVATGSFVGLTLLFEHSKGTGLTLGLVTGFLVIRWRSQPRASLLLRSIGPAAAGFAWPFGLTFLYFGLHNSLAPMLSAWIWPLSHYSLANKLPYGYVVMSTANRHLLLSGDWISRILFLLVMFPCVILSILPIVAVGTGAWFVHQRGRAALPGLKWPYWVLVSSTLSGLLLSTLATRRADFTHLNYLAPLFYLPLAWVLGALPLPPRIWRPVRPILVACILVSSTVFGIAVLWAPLNAHFQVHTPRGTIRTGEPDRVLAYVQSQVSPGERILVYPYEPLYYYLTATSSATRFDFLQPGMHTPEQFQEAGRELAAHPPRWALYETSFREKISLSWPNTPAQLLAAKDPIADYLLEHYQACSALVANGFWHFTVLVRKDGSCPPSDVAGASD